MKNSLLCLCLALLSCCNKYKNNEIIIADSLDELLEEYISQHEEDSIIMLDFWKTENHIDMVVLHEPYYDKDMIDGCFEKQGKLIVFHSDFNGLLDSLITPSNSINEMLLSKYKPWPKGLFYDGHYDACSYCIINKDSIIKVDHLLHCYNKKATGTDGINSTILNEIINKELNSNCNLITSLQFAKIDNDIYMYVNSDRFYDGKNLDGCFYRDGRMVTLHSIGVLDETNIVDTSFVKNNLALLARYKKKLENSTVKIKGKNNCYKIESPNVIVPVTSALLKSGQFR